MDIDLRERLDAAFGDGPEHRSLETRLSAGRRTLRNRRLGLAAGAVAAVAVVTIGAVALQDESDNPRSDKPPVAVDPTTETTDPTVLPVDLTWRQGCGHAGQDTCESYLVEMPPVTITDDGTPARLTEDVQVFQRIDDPVTANGVESVALETQFQGLTRWWLLIRRPNGTVVAEQADPALSSIGFEEWAAQLADPEREPGARVTLPPH